MHGISRLTKAHAPRQLEQDTSTHTLWNTMKMTWPWPMKVARRLCSTMMRKQGRRTGNAHMKVLVKARMALGAWLREPHGARVKVRKRKWAHLMATA